MRAAIVFSILLFYNTASAQFNDSIHHYVNFASTGTVNNTENTQSYILSNNFKFGVKEKDISYSTTNSWVYGRQQQQLTNNDISSVVNIDVHKTLPHFYYWGLGSYTSSYSLKINNLFQGGAGLAYNIVDKKNIMFNVSDGLLYEKSDIYLHDTVRDIYNTFRNSLRVSFKWTIKDRFEFSTVNFLQNSLSLRSDYIVKSDINLTVKIRKWLNFTSTYSYNRFNRTMLENTLFSYGIKIEQYF